MRKHVLVGMAAAVVGALAAWSARAEDAPKPTECASFSVPFYDYNAGSKTWYLGNGALPRDWAQEKGMVGGVAIPDGWRVVGGDHFGVLACR